jgi:hypothetical protein
LAAGDLVGAVVGAFFEADEAEELESTSPALFAADTGVDERQLDVAHDGEAREEVEALENEADFVAAELGELAVFVARNELAVEEVLALAGGVEEPEDVHEGAFAGAGRSDDGHKFTRGDGEVDVR